MHQIDISVPAGMHIFKVAEITTKMARAANVRIAFSFNGIEIVVQPHDTDIAVAHRWSSHQAERERH